MLLLYDADDTLLELSTPHARRYATLRCAATRDII